MTEPISIHTPARKSWRRALIFPTVFFVAGLGVAAWVVTQTDIGNRFITPTRHAAPALIDPAKSTLNSASQTSSAMAERIAELEARLARAEAKTSASVSPISSNPINGLVLAFAARRALERGLPLGPVEDELVSYFGTTQPQLVAAIASAARQPISLEELQSELRALAPSLAGSEAGWWERLSHNLASLVSVRKFDQKSTNPQSLFGEAVAALDAGKVDVAIDTVSSLPEREVAHSWLEKAKRFQAAEKALTNLEASAFSPLSVQNIDSPIKNEVESGQKPHSPTENPVETF